MNQNQLSHLEIPGRVTVLEGNGEMPKIEVITPRSQAEIYLHGAHVTHFQKRGQEPLLFLSRFSRFAPRQAIRGGIPFLFPWFGAREGEPTHGFARLEDWVLAETFIASNDAVRLRFVFPESAQSANWPSFALEYIVTISDTLQLEATVRNTTDQTDINFELCLHSYFTVRDINAIAIAGLKGTTFRDKTDNFASKTQAEDELKIHGEVDRIYLNTTGPVEIRDPGLRRTVRIQKTGGDSTVLWNPGPAKAQQMPDFGNDEYLRMMCVESGNVGENNVTLPPGQTATLSVELSVQDNS